MSIVDELRARLGSIVVRLPAEIDLLRHTEDYYGPLDPVPEIIAVAFPGSTLEVSIILAACHQSGVTVVPQGGMTGVAGGALPIAPSLLLCLDRLNEIEEIDVAAATMTTQTGVVLERVQREAEEHGMFFPLDLGARGSAQIGGNVSTNAGGNRVVRYGMMRDLVLGLEVVLADGTILTMLNKMMKNNAGYDLKHLFVGAEGTLGVITRAVLRLYPKPLSRTTALCALPDYPSLVSFLHIARAKLGGALSAFEIMWPTFYGLGVEISRREAPIAGVHGLYAIVETLGFDEAADSAQLMSALEEGLDTGVVSDAVFANSLQQMEDIWKIRECTSSFPQHFWPLVGFDISLPIGDIGRFVDQYEQDVEGTWPGTEVIFFGHVADSNLHIAVRLSEPGPSQAEIEAFTYGMVGSWRGSVSAEHGIGIHKREFLHHSRTAEELHLMRQLKTALDPRGILNPGKIF